MPASMTRKHFEALAAALYYTGHTTTANDRIAWIQDCVAIANVCARFNPTFNRARFLAACGIQEG